MTPTQFAKVAGGRAAFDHTYAEVALAAALAQARFSATLDRIGPPGTARWDPIGGEIELRGRTFEAQQLGSFDGESWLWAWANPHLAIPEDKTAAARSLRDRAATLGVAAFGVPMIAARDERVPYMFGGLAVVHGVGEAYYLANQSQVYMLAPGQLDRPKDPPIARLRAAIDVSAKDGMPCDLARAVPFAARALGVACVREEGRIVVRDGREELAIPLGSDGVALQSVALCFVGKSVTTSDVMTHLRKKRGVAELPFTQVGDAIELTGRGYAVRITRTDRLRDVMREANRAGVAEAKRYGAVLVVDAVHTPQYLGSPFAISGTAYSRAWVPTGALEQPIVGPQIGSEALLVCERLNGLPDALVYDLLLRVPYPRG